MDNDADRVESIVDFSRGTHTEIRWVLGPESNIDFRKKRDARAKT